MKNTSPVIQNTTMYKLGWGQLNPDGNVNFKPKFGNLQLDIVGFLAILGEGAVVSSAGVATLSKMIFLPRLLPAPQALLRPSRPDNLNPVKGFATAVNSGNIRDYINYIGHVMVDAETLPDYSVKCVRIVRSPKQGNIKAKVLGPTWAVAVLGCSLSCILFAICLWQQDGMAMLADICLSFLSTLIGFGNKWTLNLPQRKQSHWTPPGDVVIRYPKGSFVVVQCSEDVARELYFAPEGIEYLVAHPWKYRMIALAGTIVLMFGVIFLGNAGTNSQVAFAAAYMILNAAYWIVAALPQRYHWDLKSFTVKPQAFDEVVPVYTEDEKSDCEQDQKPRSKGIPKKSKVKPFVSYNETFTQALWKVIIATRDIDWITRSQAAPTTEAWNDWLQDALMVAKAAPKPELRQVHGREVEYFHVPNWDAQGELGRAIMRFKDGDLEMANKKTAERTQSDLAKSITSGTDATA